MLKEILTARTRPSDKALYNIWAQKISGGWTETTITGTLPLAFQAKGGALTDYTVHGTTEGAGLQTESGEPAGYKLPLTVTSGAQSQDYPLYIGDSKLMQGEYVDSEIGKMYKRNPQSYVYFEKWWKYDNNGRVEYKIKWSTEDRPFITGAGWIEKRGEYEIITHETENVVVMNIATIEQATEIEARFRDLGQGINQRTFVTINGEYVYGQNFHTTYDEVISQPDETLYVDRPPVVLPQDPPAAFPAISAYKGANTMSSTETVGSVSLTGKIKEAT